MRLEKYVKQTLLDVTNAVAEAQKESKLWIAPGRVEGKVEDSCQLISFEITVVTSTEGGGSIDVLSIAKGEAARSSESSNKISFSVPVYFQAPKI